MRQLKRKRTWSSGAILRRANSSAAWDAASSHCASSTATNTRVLARELAQAREHRGGDRLWKRRRTSGLGERERHLERLALWRRQRIRNLLERAADEIGERGERHARLGARGPSFEHAIRAFSCECHADAPERRLPDSGLSLEQEHRGGALVRAVEERLERLELGVTPDELGDVTQEPSVTRSGDAVAGVGYGVSASSRSWRRTKRMRCATVSHAIAAST